MSFSFLSCFYCLHRSIIVLAIFLLNSSMLFGQWEKVQPPARTIVKKVFNNGDNYYAVTNHAAYKSENYGQTWKEMCRFESSYSFRNIRFQQDTIYFLTSDAIQNAYENPFGTCNYYGPFPNIQIADYVLTDEGAIITNGQVVQRLNNQTFSWETVGNLTYFPSNLNYQNEPVLDYSNGIVWLYGDQGLMRSDDFGSNWEVLNDTLNVYSMFFSGDTILCETAQQGTLRSLDNGQNWTTLGNNYDFNGFSLSNGMLYGNHTVQNNTLSKIYVSPDFGETWSEIPTQPSGIFINDLLVKGNLFFCTTEYGVVRSDDGGQTWAYSNTGLEGIQFANLFSLSSLGNFVVYRESATSHFSSNGGQTWEGALLYNYFGFTELNGNYFTGPPSVYKSTGDITVWTLVDANFYSSNHVFTLGNDLGAYASAILRSSDEGQTWSVAGTVPATDQLLVPHDGALFSWNTAAIVKSLDFGANWTPVGALGLPPGFSLEKMYAYEDKLLVTDVLQGIFISQDAGETWAKISDGLQAVSSVPGFDFPVLLIGEAGIVAVNTANEVIFTPDFGQTWGYFHTGIQANSQINTGATTNNAFFLGAGETQIWRRDFSTAKLYSVSGTVFNDENNNGIQEPNETGLPGLVIELMPSELYTATVSNGTYAIAMDAINDTIRPIVPIVYAESNPTFYTANNTTSGLDFGIHLIPDIKDLSVTLTANAPFRPGFSNLLTLTYSNDGTTIQNGKVGLMIDNQLVIENIQPPPTSVNGNVLTWDFTNLQVFERQNISLEIKTPVSAIIGAPLSFLAVIDTLSDIDTINNTFVLNTTVVGSFDPNDKQVEPLNFIIENIASNDPLNYTIRFQNTGNFPASFITITDTLSQNLDPATFRVLASSHPMTWTMEGMGIVKFHFTDINLPDSTANEPASHGFVKYSIQANSTLQIGDEIENTAYIYFDFNEPVVTNTTVTEVIFSEIDEDGDGFLVLEGDCDDSNNAVYPGAEEACDGLDNDCDGQIPSTELDGDLDSFSACGGDCNDGNNLIFPNATEIPNNGIDEDCDGEDLILGVSENIVNLFKVSPNPFSNSILLSFDGAAHLNYTLLDAYGRTLLTGELTAGGSQAILSVVSFPAGVYLLRVEEKVENIVFGKRLIKLE